MQNIKDQRLIYSGHLLTDQQSLCDIIQLSDDNDTYTFHLVCPQRPATESGNNNNKSTAASSSSSNTQPQVPTGGLNPTAFPPVPPSDSTPAPTENPIMNQLGLNNGLDMRESYQALMSQYYQYMNYYYLSTPPPVIDYASYYAFANAYMNQNIPGMPTTAFNVTNATPNNNQNGPNENQANGNNRNANNNNNQADNEEAPRDWTEMLYSFSKAMVMFSIMYFYSSFGRLMLMVIIAAFLFLYRNGRLGGVQNNVNNNNNNEQANGREQPQMEQPQPNNNNNNNEANNNENRESEGQDLPDETNGANAANLDNSRYTGLRLVWVFVSSLFTSLIPDPAPIN